MDMRGLAHFIRDIRKVTANKEEEQKRIDQELGKIRGKFKESNSLSTYDRRKYVCKLMFVSMLGYPVEFGHMEGVQLLAMSGAAEKLIGYLSLTVFLHEGHELMTLTTHVVTVDLLSGKDLNTSLALTAVGNVGGRDYCEVMGEHVRNIIIRGANIQLRKKALLTYLRIWRKCREAADISDVLPLAVEWINHRQFGLACAAVTFLQGVISERSQFAEVFDKVPAALTKLLAKIIIEKQTEPEYIYYGVPAPWLQSKALRLLQHFTAPRDELQTQLLTVIGKILKATAKVVKDAQSLQKQRGTANRSNAMNSSLVELVSLVIQWELDAKLLAECTELVSAFVNDKKDANMRYIGLMLLSRLTLATQGCHEFDLGSMLRQSQPHVAVALHDPDVSLRKKALVLTYNMSTTANADEIVTELLRFLPAAGGTFKRDLSLFIVAIAEKFAVDVTWYVDTVIAVLAAAGDHLPEGIWHRLCTIVINTPNVQKHAVEAVYVRLRVAINPATAPSHAGAAHCCPEPIVRVAAVLLGEFGYQIALNANASPMDQVLTLSAMLVNTNVATKGMVLTALVKSYNLFDGTAVRDKIVKTLGQFTGSVDSELQQRAVEYLALIRQASDESLQATLEPLPPMDIDMGSIFQFLDHRATSNERSEGTDLWSEKIRDKDQREFAVSALQTATNQKPSVVEEPQPGADPEEQPSSTHIDPTSAASFLPPPSTSSVAKLDDLFSFASTSTAAPHLPTDTDITRWFRSVCGVQSGMLYSDDLIVVNVSQVYRNADARITLELRPASSIALEGLSVKLASTSASLLVQTRDHATSLPVGGTVTVQFAARSLAPYSEAPSIRLQFLTSSSTQARSVMLSVPLVSNAFCAPYPVEEVSKAEALWANAPSGDGKPFCVELRSPSTIAENRVMEVLTKNLKMFVVTFPTSPGELMGLAAHATQPGSVTEFTPLLLRLRIAPDGRSMQVMIKNPSAVLQVATWDLFQWCFSTSS